ncbi:MAG: serine/threonine-protein phosphatase [Desulfobulbus sp.]|nr:serine/threonine-protein phosphatase [Desulfobulbus sp.]
MQLVEGTCRLLGMSATYAGATDPGRVRPCNEDNLLLVPETGVFAVADGLGGLDAGDLASAIALSCLHDLSLHQEKSCSDPCDQVQTMVMKVNRHTYKQRVALGKRMATTLAMVRFFAHTATVAHVGDSRIYHLHDGSLIRLTSDHSLANDLCLQGVLSADKVANFPQRHIITRAIGAETSVQPSVARFEFVPGDLLLLCTDGLTSMVEEKVIASCLTRTSRTGEMAEQLVNLANEAGGRDNITVVVIAVES